MSLIAEKRSLRAIAKGGLTRIERQVFAVSYRLHRSIKVPRKELAVVTPPGGRNLGDQAMIESALMQASGTPRKVLTSSEFEYDDTEALSGVGTYSIRDWVYSRHLRRVPAAWRLGRLLSSSTDVWIIGADVMDGHYYEAASINTWVLGELCALRGAKVRVLGYSWNGAASTDIVRSAKRAVNAGAKPILRDEVSYERFRAQVDERCVLAADIVFSLPRVDALPEVPVSDARPYAIFNMSALVQSKVDSIDDYFALINLADGLGIRVVIVPHVTHPDSDDRLVIASLVAKYASALPTDLIVAGDLIPLHDERELIAGAVFVFTGRMHLAVLSLKARVPALVLSTQGKVEGLVRLFDLNELCVQPVAGFSSEVESLIEDIVANRDSYVRKISAALPLVEQLSNRNFE